MIKWVCGVFLLFLVCSSSLAGFPKPTHSKFVSTLGGGFLVRDKTVRYGLTFKVSDTLPRPLYVLVEFDNPLDKRNKLETELVYDSHDTLVVSSKPFSTIKNGKTYRVKMYLYSDPEHLHLVTKHKAKVKFSMNPEVAAIVGLELQ